MIELIQITNDPALARRCDGLDGMRLFVDLERLGKAQRQAGRDTFISTHQVADVAKVKSQLRRSRLMVRVNPLNDETRTEVDAVLDGGADMLMLPMFQRASELREFAALVAGRAPLVALLETAGALSSVREWIATPGLAEVYVGLNDLHLALGNRFMFQPLAAGIVDRVARVAHDSKIDFGFGGIARVDEGLLPGRDVLAEHLRLGSRSVILSRSFHSGAGRDALEREVAALRVAEVQLGSRSPEQIQADAARIAATIEGIAAAMATSG